MPRKAPGDPGIDPVRAGATGTKRGSAEARKPVAEAGPGPKPGSAVEVAHTGFEQPCKMGLFPR